MLSNVNTKRFTISVLALFVFTYVFHTFVASAGLPLNGALTVGKDVGGGLDLIIHSILAAGVITFIFTRHFEDSGTSEGVRFGILIGLLIGVTLIGVHGVMPIVGTLVLLVTTILYGVLSGIILSLTYKS